MTDTGVRVVHWGPWELDNNRPSICIDVAEGADPSVLLSLLTTEKFLATFLTLPEGSPWSGPGVHVLAGVHLNSGDTFHHDDCLMLNVCVGCDAELLAAIIEHESGMIKEHEPEESFRPTRFVLSNRDEMVHEVYRLQQLLLR